MKAQEAKLGQIVSYRHSETKTFPAIVTKVWPLGDEDSDDRANFVDLLVFTSFVVEAFTSVQNGTEVGTWNYE